MMIPSLEDPWRVVEDDFPYEGEPAEQLYFLLNYAVLAPSGHNTQPWLFHIAGDEVELYADRTRSLPVADPDDRELILSCGAALFHLCVAIRHFGYEPVVRTFPDLDDPDLLAFVRLGSSREPTLEDHRLFRAILKRGTNRQPFDGQALDAADLDALRAAARAEGVRLDVVTDPVERTHLVDLVMDGDRIQGADRAFRHEVSAWIHPNRTQRRDGIPGYAQGLGDLASFAGPLVVRTFDWGSMQAERDRVLAEEASALVVLSTDHDNAVAWLAAGRALARVLLQAASSGLSSSFLNQPVEVPKLRRQLAALLGRPASRPQLVLRLGYGEAVRHTPRRPVREVLAKSRYY